MHFQRTWSRTRLARAGAAAGLYWGLLLPGAAPAPGADPLQVVAGPSSIALKAGDRPVLQYQFTENPAKPYLAKLFTPAGVNVLRDSPSDHKHHHGLMFAVAVDGVDFWSENEKCGRQKHAAGETPKSLTVREVDVALGTQQIDWVAPDGKLLMREARTIAVCRPPQSEATLVGWQSRLETPPGKDAITLSGSPYFGLGMRFVPSMDKGGKFQNADGKTGVAGTNDVRSAWCAYTASAEGKPVTVAIFDDPRNPRHPATWFTMDQGFAYLAATLNLSKEPLRIEAGKPLVLRYGVALWDGEVANAKIDALGERIARWSAERKP